MLTRNAINGIINIESEVNKMTDFMMVVGYITTMTATAIAIGAAAMVVCFMQSEENNIKEWFDNF